MHTVTKTKDDYREDLVDILAEFKPTPGHAAKAISRVPSLVTRAKINKGTDMTALQFFERSLNPVAHEKARTYNFLYHGMNLPLPDYERLSKVVARSGASAELMQHVLDCALQLRVREYIELLLKIATRCR